MGDVSRLHIDPVHAATITARAAATRVETKGAAESSSLSGNAFDAAVAAFLDWAAASDASAVAALQTRSKAVESHASTGLADLAGMNADNATELGSL